MKSIFDAAQEVQNYFDENGWQFCFIGVVALQRWAKVREITKRNIKNESDIYQRT